MRTETELPRGPDGGKDLAGHRVSGVGAGSEDRPGGSAPAASMGWGQRLLLGGLVLLAACIVVPMALWWAFLLPGATALLAVDCVSDLSCSLTMGSGRHSTRATTSHYDGLWAAGAGLVLAALTVLAAGTTVNAAVELARGTARKTVWLALFTPLLVGLDVVIVQALERAF